MQERKEGQGSEPPQWFTESLRRWREFKQNNPRFEELLHQKVRLKNGTEMEWGQVQDCVDLLREIQTDRDYYPGIFEALVAVVKPRGIRGQPGKASRKALTLAAGILPWVVRRDGSVAEDFATVLDASYEAAKSGEGAVLVDPVEYTKEFVERWKGIVERADREWDHIQHLAHQGKEAERRKKRGKSDGPPLG